MNGRDTMSPAFLSMRSYASSCCRLLAFLGLGLLPDLPAQADTHIWNKDAAGATYDWNVPGNWTSGAFPNAAGDVATLALDITGTQTIRLRAMITAAILNLGDTSATTTSFGMTLANASGESFALTLDSGNASPAQINLSASGTPTNTLSVPLVLNSALNVNVGGIDANNSQRIVFGGLITTNDRPITFTGGVVGQTQITFNTGVLSGSAAAVITNNSNSAMIFNGTQPGFTGKLVVNNAASGSNVAGLTISNNGSLANVGEFEINGFLSGGVTQAGGTAWVGNGSSLGTNPGQRLTQNRITFNGGSLNAGGQPLNAGVTDRVIRDNVSVVDFNSGYSALTVASNTSSGTTRVLDVATLERSPGATAFVRATRFGSPLSADATTFLIGNSASYLKGSGATSGTNMSIIPWMVAANTNASAQTGDSFVTYTGDGARALVTTGGEYAGSLTAGADQNVNIASAAIANPDTALTINSLRYNSSNPSNIGAGKTLTLASGGLIFAGAGTIGTAGDSAAGTIQFGTTGNAVEGVVWSNGSASNTLGASLSGTGGLTKAGTGTLVLSGLNSYSGLTYVSGGTLQVGNGTNASSLGVTGNVTIAAGAVLSLMNGLAISDAGTLTMERFGLFNGRMTIAPGINETVGALFLGDAAAAPGVYGSVASGAQFQYDDYFTGAGTITVVPEPASAGMLLIGIAAVCARRRRES